jgi:hypothetical protein
LGIPGSRKPGSRYLSQKINTEIPVLKMFKYRYFGIEY